MKMPIFAHFGLVFSCLVNQINLVDIFLFGISLPDYYSGYIIESLFTVSQLKYLSLYIHYYT